MFWRDKSKEKRSKKHDEPFHALEGKDQTVYRSKEKKHLRFKNFRTHVQQAPVERIFSFCGTSNFISEHSFRSHLLNNPVTVLNTLLRSRIAVFVTDALIRLESLVGDAHIDSRAYLLF